MFESCVVQKLNTGTQHDITWYAIYAMYIIYKKTEKKKRLYKQDNNRKDST